MKAATGGRILFPMTVILQLAIVATTLAKENSTEFFPSFADAHTVGLWLFDETEYPYTTITDASQYEYDLRLHKGGRLVPGKFGNCLKLTPGLDPAVGYSSWKGHISFAHLREVSGRPGSGLWGPTVAPEKLLNAVAGSDFTCEFWILLMSSPIQDVVIVDFGDKYEAGFKVALKKRAAGFMIENAYAGFKATCPTVLEQLWGRAWHHVAFTYQVQSKKLRYFIDGQLQDDVPVVPAAKSQVPRSVWPESLNNTTYGIFEKAKDPKRPGKMNRSAIPDFEKRRRNRFNFAIGQSRSSELNFNGNIDELRFSDVIRYTADFALADSFSRNYRRGTPKPAVANGEPLLFGAEKRYLPNEPVMLGVRKHVFIDEVMIDKNQGVRLTMNPLTRPVSTNVRVRGGWDIPFWDHDGKIWMLRTPGYFSDVGRYRLMISENGIDFTSPDLGLIEDEGSKHNNIILTHMPSWGGFFKDTNPNAHLEEKFKAAAWVAQRGIYLYMSPDGIHWRRNETCMLPLVSGGGT
ncbi:MAG: LamG-like jellyroll fold domain-containing protein, partial [Planctomycetota bacterium]